MVFYDDLDWSERGIYYRVFSPLARPRGAALRGVSVSQRTDPATDAIIGLIVEGRYGDPFAFLGMHRTGDGLAVRAMLPAAATMAVIDWATGSVAGIGARIHPAGFFIAAMADRQQPFRYRLRASIGKAEREFDDICSFPPVLGRSARCGRCAAPAAPARRRRARRAATARRRPMRCRAAARPARHEGRPSAAADCRPGRVFRICRGVRAADRGQKAPRPRLTCTSWRDQSSRQLSRVGCPSARSRGCRRGGLRGMGAERASSEPGRRFQ